MDSDEKIYCLETLEITPFYVLYFKHFQGNVEKINDLEENTAICMYNLTLGKVYISKVLQASYKL